MPSTVEETLIHARFLAKHLNASDPYCAAIAVLMDLGVPTNYDGFAYLAGAVTLFVKNPYLRTTKEIYVLVRESLDADVDCYQIEQAMRSAILDAWKHRNEEVWRIYFQSGRSGGIKKPSNGVFISQIGYFLILWQGCCRKEVCCGK